MNKYDVIVVGGGHAGVEAAYAVHRLGMSCALVTFNKKNLEYFDCCVSAKTGDGFDDLKKLILSSFNKGVKKDDYKFMIRDRHNKLFQDVVKNLISAQKGLKDNLSLDLVAEDLRLARSYLDELVGEKFSDSLLGDIFSSYCIGK